MNERQKVSLSGLARRAVKKLSPDFGKPKARDVQKMTRPDLRRKVIQGHLKLTLQVSMKDRIGLDFYMDKKGYIELGGEG